MYIHRLSHQGHLVSRVRTLVPFSPSEGEEAAMALSADVAAAAAGVAGVYVAAAASSAIPEKRLMESS